MAITVASGYGNLPNGVIPEIFSQNVLLQFRKKAIVSQVTNTDYYGEIKTKGDTVHVILEPQITVRDYVRGGNSGPSQDIIDDKITLTVDYAKEYQFQLDDIEVQQSHIDYATMCSNKAAYALNDTYETTILDLMAAGVATANIEGTDGSPKAIGYTGSPDYTPVEAINALNRILDLQDVPNDGNRFLIADPYFFEKLLSESSKMILADAMGDSQSKLKTIDGYQGTTIGGMKLFKTNNAPVDTGGNARQVLLAGHRDATATAATLVAGPEKIRMENSFGDKYRGLMVFGGKVVRTNALAKMLVSY